ncbi:hypothetical protein Bbelb_242050 [Branchiostoma belcheri]|nr:hypothetical protein Bbelb_242050 [Branchiostoma belcheri]
MGEDNTTDAIATSNKLLCLLLFGAILIQYAGRSSVAVVLVELQMPPVNDTNTSVSQPHSQYSQFQVSVILSIFYLGQLPSSFIGGYLAYRYSAIRIFLASFGAGSIVHVLGPVMFGNFKTAVTQRVLAGLVEGLCEPAAFGVLSQTLTPRQSARVSPYIFAAYYFGQSLGKIATGFMTQRLGWQTAFYMFGALGMTCAAVAFGFAVTGLGERKDTLETQSHDKNGIKTKSVPFCHIFTSPAVWASIMLLAASYIWEETLLPLYFQQSFGIQVELVGVISGIPILLFGVLQPLFTLIGNTLCRHVSTTVARKSMAVTVFYANPFDIAPRYASVLTGTGRVICRAVGLTFPLLAAELTENKTRQEWSRVVLIKSGFFAATAVVFGVFGSGEEQPWALQLQQQRATQLFILG